MAEISIPIPKASDETVLLFFERLMSEYQFNTAQLLVNGVDHAIPWGNAEAADIKQRNKYALRVVTVTKGACSIAYSRNADTQRFATPDQVKITNNNNTLGINEIIRINELISDSFQLGAAQNAALLADPNAFASVIASHQEIIVRLEQSLEGIGRRFADERMKLQTEQETFIRDKTEEFNKREQSVRDTYGAKEEALLQRERALDDRDNMHARRSIRADLKKRLQEHATSFTLTSKTRQLRWPLHITVWLFLVLLASGVAYSWWLMGRSQNIDYPLLIKSSLLTIASLGILAWYIRWMNRWFEQHSDAEFNLKQFELDVDRASWVVETAMEWRAQQHGAIPTHLLDSISRNLFRRTERVRDDELHPADYLASALLGNASQARIKLGDAELEYQRGALKKAADAVKP